MKRRISVDDFARLVHPSDPQISPDGRYVAFTVVRPNLDENKYIHEIWVVDSESGEEVATLSGEGDSSPRWDHCSRRLIFVSRRGFKEDEKGAALYLYNLRGEPRLLLKMKWGVYLANWISDTLVGFVSPVPVRKVDEDEDYVDIRDLPPWFDGRGFVDEFREQLFILDVNSGLYRQLTHVDGRVVYWAPSRRGNRVAYIVRPWWREPEISEVRVLHLSTGEEITVIRAGKYSFSALCWSPDDRRLLLHGHDRRRGLASHTHVWIAPVEEDAVPINMTEKLDRNTSPAVSTDVLGPLRTPAVPQWLNDGTIVFPLNEGGRVGLYRLHPDNGNIEPLIKGEFVIYSFTADRGATKLALLRLSYTELPEIWMYSMGTHELRRLTNLNAWLEKEVEVSRPINLKIRASDGAVVEGWYIP
ncbi:MAG: hypothetical protein DRO12_04525, partial [Thermoprotei archaeon]